MPPLLLALWRIWKWLVHLATGKCEIVRVCEGKAPLEERTWRIGEPVGSWKSVVSRLSPSPIYRAEPEKLKIDCTFSKSVAPANMEGFALL